MAGPPLDEGLVTDVAAEPIVVFTAGDEVPEPCVAAAVTWWNEALSRERIAVAEAPAQPFVSIDVGAIPESAEQEYIPVDYADAPVLWTRTYTQPHEVYVLLNRAVVHDTALCTRALIFGFGHAFGLEADPPGLGSVMEVPLTMDGTLTAQDERLLSVD